MAYESIREALGALPECYRSQWEVYEDRGHCGVRVVEGDCCGLGSTCRVTHAYSDPDGFGNGSTRNAAEYQAAVDPKAVAALLADRDRLLDALQQLDSLDPEDFKEGHDQLSPAFRDPSFKEAFRQVIRIVNGVLHGTDEYGQELEHDHDFGTDGDLTRCVDCDRANPHASTRPEGLVVQDCGIVGPHDPHVHTTLAGAFLDNPTQYWCGGIS